MEQTQRQTTPYRAVLHVEIPVSLGEGFTAPELAPPLIAKVQAILKSAADDTRPWRPVEYKAGVLGFADRPEVIGVDIFDDDGKRVVATGPDVPPGR